jgi:2-dehydro-3-deoxyphosphogluconate aldolase/(4S)-4-hydroxy-2-oxoglutarate aldolase
MSTADPIPLIAGVPVIPVLTIERPADAVPLARALVEGGLRVLEITLRTPSALDAVRAIIAEVPQAVVGVGTVTNAIDVCAAEEAGASYLVSPGTPAQLADALVGAAVPAIPGCATVSEAMALAEHGFTALKFFPAEAAGGTAWLKSVGAPLPHIRFCPTGGINAANAAAYLALTNVVSVGGSWVAPPDRVAARDFAAITALARQCGSLRR